MARPQRLQVSPLQYGRRELVKFRKALEIEPEEFPPNTSIELNFDNAVKALITFGVPEDFEFLRRDQRRICDTFTIEIKYMIYDQAGNEDRDPLTPFVQFVGPVIPLHPNIAPDGRICTLAYPTEPQRVLERVIGLLRSPSWEIPPFNQDAVPARLVNEFQFDDMCKVGFQDNGYVVLRKK